MSIDRRTAAAVYHVVRGAIVWLLVLPILGYQRLISPMLGPSCKFHPSCSNYAVGALRAHGPVKGLALGGYRLCRCHPWQKGGLDPVPAKGRWTPDITPTGDASRGSSSRTSPRPSH